MIRTVDSLMNAIARSALALVLLIGLMTVSLAQNDRSEETVCVTGQDGNWSCGPRSNPPRAYPLPDSGISSSSSAQDRAEPLPAEPRSLDQARYENFLAPLQQTDPAAQEATAASPAQSLIGRGNFSLRIAEVGAQTDIRELAEQFALDPSLIQVAIIGTGDNERRVVLLGRFSTPAQSRQAMNGFPASIRQMRPGIERLDSFERVIPLNQLYGLESVASTSAAEPPPSVASTNQVTPQRQPSEPDPQRLPSSSALEPSTEIETPSAVEPVAVVSIASDGQITAADVTESSIKPEDLTPEPPAALPTVEAPPEQQTLSSVTQTIEPQPESRPESRPAADPLPESRPTAPVQADQPATLSSERRASNRSLSPFAKQPPAAQSSTRNVRTAEPGGRSDFQRLNARHYVIQLGNLTDREDALTLIQSAGVDPSRCYLIEVDEGAGLRWLLLMGDFDSVKSASNRLSSLPDVFRNPWVRRVSPLQKTRG